MEKHCKCVCSDECMFSAYKRGIYSKTYDNCIFYDKGQCISEMMNMFQKSKRSNVREYSHGWSFLPRIDLGKYELSIQASNSHYCIPRMIYGNLYHYTAMEVAVICKETGNLVKRNCHDIKDFPKYLELERYYDGISVFSYVPIKLISELYGHLYLKNKERRK